MVIVNVMLAKFGHGWQLVLVEFGDAAEFVQCGFVRLITRVRGVAK
jgi:hypothetical protein